MSTPPTSAPRILILGPDGRDRATLLRHSLKGWRGAAVQASSATLPDVLSDAAKLKTFDVVLAAWDCSADGTVGDPALRALRALAADPDSPAVVLIAEHGTEHTAAHAIKAGAFEYIPKRLLGREHLLGAIGRALQHQRRVTPAAGTPTTLRLFGYDVRRRIATSGNASVHLAYSAEQAREVVLKVLNRGSGSLSRDRNFERLIAEFKLLYDVQDPAVAEIYDFRATTRYCYIAMEHFPLGDLSMRLARRTTPADALGYAIEIAHALAIIHAAGIVHRDLKPANIMLRENGTVALIDFGISQASFALGTSTQEIAGTPYYMSPEQARGEAVDERTDLYALGVILFQMLTGRKPYTGDSAAAILSEHCETAIPRLQTHLHACQPLIDKLLAKDKAQRLATAREVVEAIEELRAGSASLGRGVAAIGG